jgi:general secretion pathway protein D
VAGDASQRVSVIGDPRTNSLLVRSDNPSKLNAVRQLVANLDQPGAAGNIHVVYLKNAEATKVAQTLRAVLSGEAGKHLEHRQAGSNSASATAPPAKSGTPAPAPHGHGMGSTPSFSNKRAPTPAPRHGIIQADPMTNSLIITAPEAIYNNIRKVIDQLDKPPRPGLCRSADRRNQHRQGLRDRHPVAGRQDRQHHGLRRHHLQHRRQQHPRPASQPGSTLPGNGLNLLLGGGTITVGGADRQPQHAGPPSPTPRPTSCPPNLVTLDNEEAKIVVGNNVPFVTGSYTTTTGGATNPFTTVERKDVGLTLKIKPQISEGGTVRLQIYQEASAVISSTATSTTGPSTKRSIESTVLVDDGAMIALGGLVEDTYSGGREKVPVLGDIPYLGALFLRTRRKRGKTNLIVFLRPVILRDAASSQGISAERYNYIIGQQRDSKMSTT